jgi:hypothetical protein
VHESTWVSSFTASLFAVSALAGCGSDNANPAIVPGGDETLFVPEGVPYELDARSADTHGLKIVAGTVMQFEDIRFWLVAVKNESTRFVCEPWVVATFEDSDKVVVGGAQGPAHAATHLTQHQTPERCLSAGEVGVAMRGIQGDNLAVPIRRIVYQLHGIFRDAATPFSDLALDNIVIEDASADATFVTGTMTNHGANTLEGATASLYPLNKVGRPFSFGIAVAPAPLAPRSSWNFQMAIHGPIGRYAAFIEYHR